jgi:hypothetical protein
MKEFPMKILTLCIPLAILSFVALSCKEATLSDGFPAFPVNDDFSSIANPRDRWNAYHISSYTIEQHFETAWFYDNIRIIVANDKKYQVIRIPDNTIVNPKLTYYKTIDELFDLIDILQYSLDSSDIFKVTYHPRFGYPTMIMYVQGSWTDDEYNCETNNLIKILD